MLVWDNTGGTGTVRLAAIVAGWWQHSQTWPFSASGAFAPCHFRVYFCHRNTQSLHSWRSNYCLTPRARILNRPAKADNTGVIALSASQEFAGASPFPVCSLLALQVATTYFGNWDVPGASFILRRRSVGIGMLASSATMLPGRTRLVHGLASAVLPNSHLDHRYRIKNVWSIVRRINKQTNTYVYI